MRKSVVLLLISCLALASCVPKVKEITDEERKRFTADADLILEAVPLKSEIITKSITVNAVEQHPDINYLVTFEINKVAKGKLADKLLGIAVHSPTLSFRIYSDGSIKKNSLIYILYIKETSEGMIFLGAESTLSNDI